MHFLKKSLAHISAIFMILPSVAAAQEVHVPNIVGSFGTADLILNANKNAWAAPECIKSNKWNVDCTNDGNSPTQTEPQTRSLVTTYTPSKSLRKKNLANFVSKTRATDPAGAAQMEQLFASGDIIGQIDGIMQANGLSVSNAADAYAVWWVSAWQASIGDLSEKNGATYQAVSTQAARGFASTPQFTNATDAQKQEMAEAMLIQAAMIDAHKETYANDPAMMAKLSAAVKQGAKKSGLDLDAMTLTEDGFVKAKGRKTGAAPDAAKATNPAAQDTAVASTANVSDTPADTKPTTPNYALLAAIGTASLGGVFLLGKAMGKKG